MNPHRQGNFIPMKPALLSENSPEPKHEQPLVDDKKKSMLAILGIMLAVNYGLHASIKEQNENQEKAAALQAAPLLERQDVSDVAIAFVGDTIDYSTQVAPVVSGINTAIESIESSTQDSVLFKSPSVSYYPNEEVQKVDNNPSNKGCLDESERIRLFDAIRTEEKIKPHSYLLVINGDIKTCDAVSSQENQIVAGLADRIGGQNSMYNIVPNTAGSDPTNSADISHVVTHELGHDLGLVHATTVDNSMPYLDKKTGQTLYKSTSYNFFSIQEALNNGYAPSRNLNSDTVNEYATYLSVMGNKDHVNSKSQQFLPNELNTLDRTRFKIQAINPETDTAAVDLTYLPDNPIGISVSVDEGDALRTIDPTIKRLTFGLLQSSVDDGFGGIDSGNLNEIVVVAEGNSRSYVIESLLTLLPSIDSPTVIYMDEAQDMVVLSGVRQDGAPDRFVQYVQVKTYAETKELRDVQAADITYRNSLIFGETP